jgi:hypothetical protein
MKETSMFNTKTVLAAASLAVVSAAGLGVASAAPWDRHDFHRAAVDHRVFVDQVRLTEALRGHHYRVIGAPYFVHDRYVVRTRDRFGRIVFVQVDPYSGAFVREVIL